MNTKNDNEEFWSNFHGIPCECETCRLEREKFMEHQERAKMMYDSWSDWKRKLNDRFLSKDEIMKRIMMVFTLVILIYPLKYDFQKEASETDKELRPYIDKIMKDIKDGE